MTSRVRCWGVLFSSKNCGRPRGWGWDGGGGHAWGFEKIKIRVLFVLKVRTSAVSDRADRAMVWPGLLMGGGGRGGG